MKRKRSLPISQDLKDTACGVGIMALMMVPAIVLGLLFGTGGDPGGRYDDCTYISSRYNDC